MTESAVVRPPRILYIITTLYISGPSLHVILLTAAMRKAGYETFLVIGETGSDGFKSLAAQYDIQPIVVPTLARSYNPVRHIRSFYRLYRLIKDYGPDLVHTHTTTAGFLGRLAAWLANVPVIVHTLHFYPFQWRYSRFSSMFFILTERLGGLVSHNVITLSETLRQAITERYRMVARRGVTVLPVGYDLETFAQTKRHMGVFRKTYGIPAGVALIGIVGRLMAVKNHALFLEAAAHIKQVLPDAHFVIVGDGELKDALQDQARQLGLEASVTFTGWVQDMAQVYSDLDVLVISSHSEGTPVPIIEALAAGCPVVATNVGGVADLLVGTGCAMVPAGDASALAQAIQHTLTRQHTPEPARTMMMDRYHIGRLVQDLDGLYRGLLSRYARQIKKTVS